MDDIPKGQFICVYTGDILNEQVANEFGKCFGDEYLADLDLIEVVENLKLDYESDVEDIEQIINVPSNSGKIVWKQASPRII